MVRLRLAIPADLAFITTLERAPENAEGIGQWSDEEHLDAIARPDREVFVIEEASAPAGYLIAYDGRSGAAGVYVKRILVRDKERGVGRAAFRLYLARAFDELQAPFVWLHVRVENARARHVYHALGFRRFDAMGGEAIRCDALVEPPPPGRAFAMRLDRGQWA